jgi:outer membrane protein assembly factor BamB
MDEHSDWPTRMKDVQRTGYSPDEFAPPLRLVWKFKREGYVWAGPTIGQNHVFFGGDRLHALNLTSGELLWRSDETNAFGASSPTLWEDLLFVCADESLYALDAQTGAIRFEINIGNRDSSPCVYEAMVLWGARGGRFYAADAHTGAIKWMYEAQYSRYSDPIRFTPSILADTIYFGHYPTVYALDVHTGALKWYWREELDDSPVDAAPIWEDALFVAIKNGGLFALDTTTGQVKWHYATQYGPFAAPCVADEGIVYAASRRLHAVSCQDGREIWTSDQYGFDTSAPIIVGEHIYIGGGHYRFVYGFDRRTGQKVWEYPTGDLVFSTPAYAHGRLVIGSHDGYVYCFEEDK